MEPVTVASKVNPSPQLPRPFGPDLKLWAVNMVQQLSDILQQDATSINQLVTAGQAPSNPVLLPTFLKTTLPVAADWKNALIIVSNDAGGLTVAFSDGTNWRRVQDRNIIS